MIIGKKVIMFSEKKNEIEWYLGFIVAFKYTFLCLIVFQTWV